MIPEPIFRGLERRRSGYADHGFIREEPVWQKRFTDLVDFLHVGPDCLSLRTFPAAKPSQPARAGDDRPDY